ncbi:MAG TPA: hypothetical protein VMZ91_14955 [Candidatus Paceibacterota bacterium]|nr:hypothetical protein [Candidatus Paceibacterota bacterium]
MYKGENQFPKKKNKKKIRPPKEQINFEKKLGEAFKNRKERIDDLKKEILSFLIKNKIDDRDGKSALREALKELKSRNDIDKR